MEKKTTREEVMKELDDIIKHEKELFNTVDDNTSMDVILNIAKEYGDNIINLTKMVENLDVFAKRSFEDGPPGLVEIDDNK